MRRQRPWDVCWTASIWRSKDASRRAFAAVRPPGHHALRDRAMGFCLFGNIAIGAMYALARGVAERVLIVDWDVHHGNGTQALVEDDPRVRMVSMHQWPWYPGTGAAADRGPHQSIWNVPMAAGLNASAYGEALLGAVDAATTNWSPSLVLISAGFDSLAGDPLGGFTLALSGHRAPDERVGAASRALVRGAGGECTGGRVRARSRRAGGDDARGRVGWNTAHRVTCGDDFARG